MANLRSWLFSFCLALAGFSLAGHFIADAACWPAEARMLSQCNTAGPGSSTGASELVANPLHTGVVTPAGFSIAAPVVLCLILVGVGFNKLSRFVPPPIQPPKATSIA